MSDSDRASFDPPVVTSDETLRANFNVTLHQVPCEYLSVDVADMTGMNRHNISKDILKWRLDSQQRVIDAANPEVARTNREHMAEAKKALGAMPFDLDAEGDYEPPDTNLSQALTAETFEGFLKQHELSVVNFFAPWCIWCRRFEPVYLKTASEVPDLHFHGHARLAQVDCVANQAFCFQQSIRAYPTVRMYKDGDASKFELFTGERTDGALLGFIKEQMALYKTSHDVARSGAKAQFDIKRGALSAGSDLYSAKMLPEAAKTYCGANPSCAGFTWRHAVEASVEGEGVTRKDLEREKGQPKLVYFKAGLTVEQARASLNSDNAWTSYIKLRNDTGALASSSAGSLSHGPEGCMIAGHLNVRKVPGTLTLSLHHPGHDHEAHLINSSHVVNELWFGEPLSTYQMRRMPRADIDEVLSPTSHRLDGLPFASEHQGRAHVHYLKVVTKVVQHADFSSDLLTYKYTVHSNMYEAEAEPSIEFKWDLSPVSIVVQQEAKPFYRFITSACAIIGGVFTVIGLIENLIHVTSSALSKKQI